MRLAPQLTALMRLAPAAHYHVCVLIKCAQDDRAFRFVRCVQSPCTAHSLRPSLTLSLQAHSLPAAPLPSAPPLPPEDRGSTAPAAASTAGAAAFAQQDRASSSSSVAPPSPSASSLTSAGVTPAAHCWRQFKELRRAMVNVGFLRTHCVLLGLCCTLQLNCDLTTPSDMFRAAGQKGHMS